MLQRRFGDDAVEAPPEMDERSFFWMRTFQLLSPSRPASEGGVRPIPLTEMAALSQMIDMPCSHEEYVTIVRAMDGAFVDHCQKAQSKAGAKQHGVQKRSKGR